VGDWFERNDRGPGLRLEIVTDGNCGYRALSMALTGTEANHAKIRADLMSYLDDEVRRGHTWWGRWFASFSIIGGQIRAHKSIFFIIF
jgi:hypothetical protein